MRALLIALLIMIGSIASAEEIQGNKRKLNLKTAEPIDLGFTEESDPTPAPAEEEKVKPTEELKGDQAEEILSKGTKLTEGPYRYGFRLVMIHKRKAYACTVSYFKYEDTRCLRIGKS